MIYVIYMVRIWPKHSYAIHGFRRNLWAQGLGLVLSQRPWSKELFVPVQADRTMQKGSVWPSSAQRCTGALVDLKPGTSLLTLPRRPPALISASCAAWTPSSTSLAQLLPWEAAGRLFLALAGPPYICHMPCYYPSSHVWTSAPMEKGLKGGG